MYQILDLKFLKNEETIASFLIKTTEGYALIESGPTSTLPALEAALAAHQLKISDIKYVFLSHIHFDHAGAAWKFAEQGATIYVHQAGAKHLASPEKLYNSAKMIYGDKMEYLWGEMRPIAEAQIHSPENGEGILIGDKLFVAWHTPGHAVHHIAWQVDDVLFAGDVAGVRIKNGIVVPPCPPPDINIEDWQASINLMRKLPLSKLLLTHFGEVEEVQNHLDLLEKILLDWANWILPYYETGQKVEAIVPLFEQYVAKTLIENGVLADDIPKYQSANPAFMSVAGLMRYWHKKKSLTFG
jgi:glyoxylase-like metal-dependent hydrolase (beta-lactamase superfamily II)